MGGEWRQMSFVDVIDIIGGGTPKTTVPEYWSGDIPWLSVADFNNGYRWVSTAEKHITQLGLSESATTLLNRGDIIISARGTVGVLAQLARPMAFNQSCYGIRGKPGIAENDFLYYALRQTVANMKQIAHGGVFDTITRDTFKVLHAFFPPLSEQRAIAHILGTLDDKIELNRRINQTLEEMARALFKSWFVDFAPVRAKAEGRDPGLPKPLADLFPDTFEDSELGEIPKGWEARSFAETVDILGGGTPKTSVPEYWDGYIPWYSVVDAPQDADVFVVDTHKKTTQAGIANSSTRILPQGTSIISARGTVGRVTLVGTPMAMNQSCYGLRDSASERGYYTYFATRNLVAVLRQRVHGAVFDTITRDTLQGVSVPVPGRKLIRAFEAEVAPLLERILANLHQSRTLATIRDALLPKLLSGEISIQDAQKLTEEFA